MGERADDQEMKAMYEYRPIVSLNRAVNATRIITIPLA